LRDPLVGELLLPPRHVDPANMHAQVHILFEHCKRLTTAYGLELLSIPASAGQPSHHNDDLAFLRFAPWRVPPESPSDAHYNRARRLAQELDRQHCSRWEFEGWKDAMGGNDPGTPDPSSFADLYPRPDDAAAVGGDWNHEAWTRGIAGMWISGLSQVVFEVPQWRAPFSCDVDTILRLCTQLPLVVAPQLDASFDRNNSLEERQRVPVPIPHVQAGHHLGDPPPITAIEFPTLLYISPYANARWRLRPTVAGAAAELWALELERPGSRASTSGTPRKRQQAGHLFAFAHREVEAACWPQDIEGAPSSQSDDKYSPYESPKTTLYDATRRLLVLQLREDNGDITAEHFALTGLGASAHLHYRPLLEPQGTEPTKEVQTQPAGAKDKLPISKRLSPKDEGLLTEWIQKADLGRDYYTKESFAGWWMPWGFKAESVTITERLLATDPWMEFTHGGARMRRHNLLRRASWQLPEGEYIDLEGQESHLIAVLVARKFARVKPRYPRAGLIRVFGTGESEDFFNATAQAARAAGIVSVEVLVDRTPVLANQYCQVPESDFVSFIQNGLDLRVAGGTGKDAGREIFLPRIRDFAQSADGELVSQLVPYRFPMCFTYRDGKTETVEMPMLFVPTMQLGQELYDQLPEPLRAAKVKSKIAFVDLPSPGAINPREMGPAKDLETAGEYLAKMLPNFAGRLVTSQAVGHSGSLSLVTDGLNAFIDGPADAIMRLLSSDKVTGLENYLKKVLNAATGAKGDLKAFADSWRGELVTKLMEITSGLSDKEASQEVAEILRSVRRLFAWGVDEIVEVDHLFAAERLEQWLRVPLDNTFENWRARIQQAKKAFGAIDQIGTAEATQEELAEAAGAAKDLTAFLDELDKAAVTVAGGASVEAQNAYGNALRIFLVQWATKLGGHWKRHVWDVVFHFIGRAGTNLPAAEENMLIAAYKKRLQIRLLANGGADAILLKAPEDLAWTLDIKNLVVALPKFESSALTEEVQKWLTRVRGQVASDSAALERLLRGVEQMLGSERSLRLRLHRLIEDLGVRGQNVVKQELQLVCNDVATHVAAALKFARDGRARFERFVLQVEATPELVESARGNILNCYDKLRDQVRTRLRTVTNEAGQTADTIKRLLVSANPEQLRKKLEDIVDLSGHRIRDALRAQFDSVFAAADGFFQRLDTLSKNAFAAGFDAVHEGEEALLELEKLFHVADEAAGEMRETLATILQKNADKIAGKLKELAGEDLPSASKQWLQCGRGFFQQAGAKTLHSWRFGQAAVILIEDLLRQAESVRSDASDQLATLRRQVLGEIAQQMAVTDQTARNVLDQIKRAAVAAGVSFEERATALAFWIEKKTESIQRPPPDQLTYVLIALLALRRDSGELFDRCLSLVLADLADSELRQKLEENFPQVAGALADIRRVVGEVDNLQDVFDKLGADTQKNLQKALDTVVGGANDFAEKLRADLNAALGYVEGDAFSLAKRTLASLEAPAMLRDFEDQTRKAIYESSQLAFKVSALGEGITSQLAFPRLDGFKATVQGLPGEQTVVLAQDYIDNGLRNFNQAAGAVFGELKVKNPVASVANSVGIVQAQESIKELSRDFGAVSNTIKDQFHNARANAVNFVDDFKHGTEQDIKDQIGKIKDLIKEKGDNFRAKAEDLLPPEIPKLLGSLPLGDILGVIGDPSSLPKMISHELPDRIERSRSWSKKLDTPVNAGIVKFVPATSAGGSSSAGGGSSAPAGECVFRLDARAVIYLPLPGRDRVPPAYSVRGQLGAFDISVQDMLLLHFQSLSFTAENGSFKCTPKLGKGDAPTDIVDLMEFEGSLRFIEDLRRTVAQFLSELPFKLQIRDDYIFATFDVPIPNLGFGAVSITGIFFRVGLGLPLGGGPLIFRFALSDRIETFKVAVAMYAGGGFFALEQSSDPQKSLVEGAFEFGGVISLSLAVVQGELSVMAGFYFRRASTSTVLESYFRACGNVTVFGFIEIGILIMFALGYHNENGASLLSGQVTVRIRVKIAFFSKSFSFQYEKKIAGSGSSGQTALWLRRRWQLRERELIVSAEAADSVLMPIANFHGDEKPKGTVKWRWGEPAIHKDKGERCPRWPSAGDFPRPAFARPPQFSESMTPGDWGSYWRRYEWSAFRRASNSLWKPESNCDNRDISEPVKQETPKTPAADQA